MSQSNAYLNGVEALRHQISTKLDLNGVVARELGCEGNGESAITLVDDVDVDVTAVGRSDTAGDFAVASLSRVDGDEGLPVDGHSLLDSLCQPRAQKMLGVDNSVRRRQVLHLQLKTAITLALSGFVFPTHTHAIHSRIHVTRLTLSFCFCSMLINSFSLPCLL